MHQLFTTKNGQIVTNQVPAPAGGAGLIRVETHFSVISPGTETMRLKAPARAARRRSLVKRGLEVLREDGITKLAHKVRNMDNVGSTLGYSAAGVVLEVGEDVVGFKPGDRVACAGAGYANHAEVLAIPPMLCVRLPEEASLKRGAFSTLGAIALQGIRRAGPELGDVVVVTGLGVLGLLTVQLLRANGCRVIGVDLSAERIELAKRLGAEVALHAQQSERIGELCRELTGGAGADRVLLCAATQSDEPMKQALEWVRQRGRVVVVGAVGMNMPRAPFYHKEAEVTISCSYGPGRYDPSYEEGGLDYPQGFVRWTLNRNLASFAELVHKGAVDIDAMCTHEFAIADGPRAYDVLTDSSETALGVTLRYPAAESTGPGSDLRQVISTGAGISVSDKQLGIAVLGVGGFARTTLLPAIVAHPDCQLLYAIANTSRSATSAAKEFNAAHAATDCSAAWRDEAVDAVVIATRHDSHCALTVDSLKAGKHVLVEKPLGLTAAEIDEVLAAWQDAGTVLAVGHNRRFSPAAEALRSALVELGAPAQLLCRVNAGEIPPEHWTQSRAVGGGRIIGELCHFIDLCQFLVGDSFECVDFHAAAIPPDNKHVHSLDNASVTLRFANGSIATLCYTSSGDTHLPKERIEVHSAGRSFVLDDFRQLSSYGASPGASWKSARVDKGHKAEINQFVKAARGLANTLPGVEVTARVARLAIDIDQALRTDLSQALKA